MRPAAVAHADWGVAAAKRWVATAILRADGRYIASTPVRVGSWGSLHERMGLAEPADGSTLFGFDFPIGLPRAYAARAGITSFPVALEQFGSGRWSEFWDVADSESEIGLCRPFYPQRPGGRRRAHLTERLALDSHELFRECDRATGDRRAACPLFWTLGGNQVGKGALSGWRDVLQPARMTDAASTAIWPFDGRLANLLSTRRTVVAETYPAELYGHLGVRFSRSTGGGKRQPLGRRAQAGALVSWSEEAEVRLTDELRRAIGAGFGSSADGEDRFDAVIGLFGMLNVVLGRRPPGDPPHGPATTVEGWILGQHAGHSEAVGLRPARRRWRAIPADVPDEAPGGRSARRPGPR